jgi:Fe-S-cluster-containing hydrogenase component 2
MDAVDVDEGQARVALERCIGCGLCITTCPTGAMQLAPAPHRKIPPKDTGRLYARMFRERFGTLGLASAVGRRVLGLKY